MDFVRHMRTTVAEIVQFRSKFPPTPVHAVLNEWQTHRGQEETQDMLKASQDRPTILLGRSIVQCLSPGLEHPT